MKMVNKKSLYLLALLVICLLNVIIAPTYAKFASNYITENDVVGLNLTFNIGISNIEEYEELIIPAGGTEKFNVEITNNTGNTVYYGVWYKMVSPDTLSSDMRIGRLSGTSVTTSGSIDTSGSTTVTIAIVNSSTSNMKVNIGVASSSTSVNDIEYLGGKYLITGDVTIPKDIMITSIKIDGTSTDSLPTSGIYTMTSTCTKGSTLSWNTYNLNVTYEAGSKVGDSCSLEFTSSDYPKLSSMSVGSYVAYTGSGGTVGSTSVACQINGPASSSTDSDETEAPNSCKGQNAREDLDTSNYTYGYCYTGNGSTIMPKFITTGWRIAYIDTTDASNPRAILVSAGSPECNKLVLSTGNETYIKTANAKALKYCNTNYVDGNCTCSSSTSGRCSIPSMDAWAINDTDFYYMTKAISGYGKRLTEDSSSLGDSGGSLPRLHCYSSNCNKECGYQNDLIINGGLYYFAALASKSTDYSTYGVGGGNSGAVISWETQSISKGLRPIINLSSSVYVTGGSGTIDDPYQIGNTKMELSGDASSLDRTLLISSTDDNISTMCFSNTSSSASDCGNWVTYATSYNWRLSEETGIKTIYAFFRNSSGNIHSATVTNKLDFTISEDFEDGTIDSNLTITSSGSKWWTVTNGRYQSASVNATNGSSTAKIQFTPILNATLSFDYGVSSETTYPQLTITLSGSDSSSTTLLRNVSTGGSISNYTLQAGVTYTLSLSFSTNFFNTGYGYIDNLVIKPY